MSRLLRRAAVVTATAALALSLGTVPANAIPPESMIVITYYDDAGAIVGQKWFGCSYDPDGDSWGTLEGRTKYTFTPCQF